MPWDNPMFYVAAGLGPILLGITILVSLWLLPDLVGPWKSDLVRMILQTAAWSAILIGLMAIPMLGLTDVSGFAVLILMIPVLFVAVTAIALYRRYRAGQQALLWTLAMAVRRAMPLEPVLVAFAAERGGRFGARIRLLARYLRAGWKLPDALSHLGGLVPHEALVIVRTAYEGGDLAEGLRRASEAGGFRDELWDRVAAKAAYLSGVIVIALGIVLYLSISILPILFRIARDFGIAMPPLTQWMASASGGWMAVPLILALTVALAAFFYAWLRYAGFVQVDLPGVEQLLRRADTATILDAFVLATRRQRPLPEVIAALAKHHPKHSIRVRLRRVVEDLHAGADWLESLARCGLIGQADLAVFQAAQRAGNLPWAMAEMADSNRRRLSYRLQAVLHLLFPACILTLGLLVGLIVVGYFAPIVAIIHKACP
jgi:general secretion pathway protein F